MPNRLDITRIPDGTVNGELASAVGQFFRLNPAITVQDISISFDDRVSTALDVLIAYDSDGGALYKAEEFVQQPGGASIGFQIENYLQDNSTLQVFKSFIITRRSTRAGGEKRVFIVFAEIKSYDRLLIPGAHLPVISAQEIGIDATDQVKQSNQDQTIAVLDRFTVRNPTGTAWPAATGAVAAQQVDEVYAASTCCGTAGADDVGSLPTPLSALVCDSSGGPPPIIIPPPPLTKNCCLRVVHECLCPAGTDFWSLVSVDCVNNAFCTGLSFCDGDDSIQEFLFGCTCGDPVPQVVPDPFCDPDCCTSPPPGDCCLQITWDCECVLNNAARWIVTHNDCVANGSCGDGLRVTKTDEDGDGDIDRIVYTEQGGCPCGTVGLDNQLALVDQAATGADDNPNAVANDTDNPAVIPTLEPDCCRDETADCCLQINYVCQEVPGLNGGVWIATGAQCVQQAQCTDPGTGQPTVEGCVDGVSAMVTLYDGCNCGQEGAFDLAAAQVLAPQPPNVVDAACLADCGQQNCAYTWRSTYDCDLSAWGAPVLIQTSCDVKPTATAWAVTAGCNAERTTVGAACNIDADCPLPEAIAGPALGAPAGCCSAAFLMGLHSGSVRQSWKSDDGLTFVDNTNVSTPDDHRVFIQVSGTTVWLLHGSSSSLGVLASTDGGDSWAGTGDQGQYVPSSLYARGAIDASTGVAIYCEHNTDLLSLPQDITYGRRPAGGGDFAELSVPSITAADDSRFQDVANNGAGIWVVAGLHNDAGAPFNPTFVPTIFRSTDDGATFTDEHTRSFPDSPNLDSFYASVAYSVASSVWVAVGVVNEGALLKPILAISTSSDGTGWSNGDGSGNDDAFVDLLSDPGNAGMAIAVETDGNGTWCAIIIDFTDGVTFIARSVDDGNNWSRVNPPNNAVDGAVLGNVAYTESLNIWRAHVTNDSSTSDSRMWLSTDGGATWSEDTSVSGFPDRGSFTNFISEDVLPH